MSKIEDFYHQGVPARCIRLVGTSATSPAPHSPDVLHGMIIVKVRDFLGIAEAGAHVVLDFNYAGAPCVDSKLCLASVPGQTLTCSGGVKQISGTTDGFGNATFTVLGASDNPGSTSSGHVAPYATTACCAVIADGLLLGTKQVAILDQNGSLPGGDGVNGADARIIMSGVIATLAGQPYFPRLDVNCDGAVDGADASYELACVVEALAGAGSGSGCHADAPAGYCPP